MVCNMTITEVVFHESTACSITWSAKFHENLTNSLVAGTRLRGGHTGRYLPFFIRFFTAQIKGH
jgi:hypothetical protein